jgi:hypothetical protein
MERTREAVRVSETSSTSKATSQPPHKLNWPETGFKFMQWIRFMMVQMQPCIGMQHERAAKSLSLGLPISLSLNFKQTSVPA